MSQPDKPATNSSDDLLPVEIEFYIEPDGTVTFADLAADVIPVAQALDPDHRFVCEAPPRSEPAETTADQIGEGTEDA